MKKMELGYIIRKVKIYFCSANILLAASFLFPLSCCASGQGLNKTG